MRWVAALALIISAAVSTIAVSHATDQVQLNTPRVLLPYMAKSQPAPTPTPVPTPTPPPPSYEQRVVDLVNQHRAAAGCGPLQQSLQLTSAAQRHTGDMAAHDFFSHTGSDGSTPASRAQDVGYFWGTGENIAAGQSTPEDVVNAWMSSAGHRANILNCSYHAIGVSYVYDANDAFGPYRHYWTQDFGQQ